MPEVSVVILTLGTRKEALRRSIASVRAQAEVETEIVIVGNGAPVVGVDADVVVDLEDNVGIPGGRNRGAEAASAPLLCFLDDDGELIADRVLADVCERFAAERRLAVVGLGIVDERDETVRRHHPRLGAASGGGATSFPGGAAVIRRSAFNEVGGLATPFFYALEETDLAWRLIDRGWSVQFDPRPAMRHPRTSPSRHRSFVEHTARNRVWLAHRNLPFVLGILYVIMWTGITAVRNWREPAVIAVHLRSTLRALQHPVGPRQPISWRTAARLTRLGRPPIV